MVVLVSWVGRGKPAHGCRVPLGGCSLYPLLRAFLESQAQRSVSFPPPTDPSGQHYLLPYRPGTCPGRKVVRNRLRQLGWFDAKAGAPTRGLSDSRSGPACPCVTTGRRQPTESCEGSPSVGCCRPRFCRPPGASELPSEAGTQEGPGSCLSARVLSPGRLPGGVLPDGHLPGDAHGAPTPALDAAQLAVLGLAAAVPVLPVPRQHGQQRVFPDAGQFRPRLLCG